MALVIGLTGGIGSGKSSVATMFKELGADIVDTDEISHELTAAGGPGAEAIAAEFGAEYLGADGALDRKRMRDLVFADAAARKKLEAILHPMIRAGVQMAVANAQAPYVLLVVPLLVETGAYRELIRRVLVVDTDEQQQVDRVTRRNALSAEQVRGIMAAQATREERLRHADDIVHNDTDLAMVREQVEQLHKKYLALAGNGAW